MFHQVTNGTLDSSSQWFTWYGDQIRNINLVSICLVLRVRHLHCSIIFTYDGINDKTLAEEWILYHVYNCVRFHYFIYLLKFLWSLVLFSILTPLNCRIKVFPGLFVYNHTNNTLGYPSDYYRIPTIGFISPDRLYLLTYHIICNFYFYPVFVYLIIW